MGRDLPVAAEIERVPGARRAAGAWSGGMPRRLALLLLGLACFSLGLVVTLQSQVGLGPWDVFHQGVSRRLGISFGTASIAVGFAILLLAWALGATPGIGSVANMALVGAFVDLYLFLGLVPDFAGRPFALRLLVDCVGVAIVGVGTALYIKANLGAGPRDGLMLTLARRSGGRVGVIRAAIELAALAVGFVLGGTAGLGTLVFALGIGPAVGVAFRVFGVKVAGKR
jgi:uncharacterized membrane protein YczE